MPLGFGALKKLSRKVRPKVVNMTEESAPFTTLDNPEKTSGGISHGTCGFDEAETLQLVPDTSPAVLATTAMSSQQPLLPAT
ncbi:hypothetical protein VTO58DRAFT_111434 [Aureobasidium pullulans]